MNPERIEIEARFAGIRAYFLECLQLSGHARTELYYRPKPGDAREPTEEEIVRRWAKRWAVPVSDIVAGIARAFAHAAERGQAVSSFRDCVPHIEARLGETHERR
ncbi:MAG: hypothetical protein LAN84_09780 [Acidobacteriia bacterium]|nr:hypothetical protein [Terriglobia bacterium]